MTILKCSAANCVYNDAHQCSRGEINVMGESARIARLTGTGAMQSRLCDLGFTENSRVTCLFPSAFGDPRAYRIRDTVVALRSGDARTVLCLAEGGKK